MSLQLTRVNRFADTRRVAGAVRRFVLKQPGSVAISILLVVVSVTTSLLAPPHARQGYPGSLPRPSTATENSSVTFLVAHHPIELFLGLAATLLLVGVSERRIGLKRTLLAYAVTALVALGSAAVIQFTVMALFGNQTQLSYRVATVPLYAPAVGTILTASAFAGPLWRRRIRVLGFAATATFVLFEGSFSGVSTLIAAAAGLALGVLLRSGRRIARPTWARSSHHEARVLVSTLVAISALGPFLTAVSPTPVGPLVSLGALFRDSFPRQALSRACQVSSATHGNDFVLNPYGDCTRSLALGGLHTPGTIAVGLLPLLVLLIAAFFIRRGRRLAVVVAIAINVVLGLSSAASVLVAQSGTGPNDRLIALHVLLSLVSALIPWGIATMLLLLLPHFAIPTSPAHGRRLVVWIGSAAVLLVGGYTVVGALEPAMFVPSVSPLGLLVSGFEHLLPVGFIGIDHIGSVPTGGLARVLFENIGWIFWTLVAVAVLSAMRVPPGRDRRDASAAIRVLLERGSAGNLSYMSTWQGNSIWFAGDRSTAVAYRLVGDIAITIGEPIGAPEHSVRTIEAFAQWCDDQSYVPVFYSVRAELSPAFRAMSWYELPVGEETVLRPRTFSMQGKKWQDVRSSINRAAKEGVRAEWTTYAQLPPAITRQIQDISEQWVADKGLPEMGFTLGGLDELQDRSVALMLAIDDADHVLAVTSWLPSYRDGSVIGWTLDFMRRRPDSMNGVMEFVIASTAVQAQADDLEFLSLSAAPLASSTPTTDDTELEPTERLLAFIGRTLEPAYGFRSLLNFKKKFQPDYEKLIMTYADPLDLPRIGAALARAYLPDMTPRHLPQLLRSKR